MQYIDKKIAAFSTLDQFISWLDTLSVVEASQTKSHINEIYAEDWDLSSLDSTILPWTNVCTEAEKLTYLRYYYINDALSILIADAIEGMLMLKRNLLLPWAIDPRSSHIKTFDLPFMNENEDVQMNIDPKSSHIKAFDLPFMNENENAQMNIDEDDISNIDHDDFARISWYSHKLPITIKYQQNNIEIKKQLPASFEYFCGLLAGISISGANITASIFDYDITDMDSGLFRKLFMFRENMSSL